MILPDLVREPNINKINSSNHIWSSSRTFRSFYSFYFQHVFMPTLMLQNSEKNLEIKSPKKTKKTSKINSYRQASQWPRDDATSDESEIIIVKPSHQTPHRE